MTIEEMCDLLVAFQRGTPTIRGRRVDEGMIFISLDGSRKGQLEATLEVPGGLAEQVYASHGDATIPSSSSISRNWKGS